MTQTPDTPFIVGYDLQQTAAYQIYVTPSGGTQTTLADALALLGPGAGKNLPTSSAGLATGTFWNNGGVVCVA